jgi:single-stranded-DNA-specific exonuclease
MAAGLSLEPNRIDAFRDWLEAHAAADPAALEEARVIGIDALMAPGAATPALYERIARTGPFGIGASEPRFAVASVSCDRARTMGEGGHLRFIARNETGQVSCMAWRAGGTSLEAVLRSGALVHLVGHLKRDDWQGREGVRFDVEDAAPASE